MRNCEKHEKQNPLVDVVFLIFLGGRFIRMHESMKTKTVVVVVVFIVVFF